MYCNHIGASMRQRSVLKAASSQIKFAGLSSIYATFCFIAKNHRLPGLNFSVGRLFLPCYCSIYSAALRLRGSKGVNLLCCVFHPVCVHICVLLHQIRWCEVFKSKVFAI